MKLNRDKQTMRVGMITAAAMFLTLGILLSGCKTNDPTVSNGDPDDAAHLQAKAQQQQNLQNALNTPGMSAEEKARIQQGAAMAGDAAARNATVAHAPGSPPAPPK